jgi:hypothetical protein
MGFVWIKLAQIKFTDGRFLHRTSNNLRFQKGWEFIDQVINCETLNCILVNWLTKPNQTICQLVS